MLIGAHLGDACGTSLEGRLPIAWVIKRKSGVLFLLGLNLCLGESLLRFAQIQELAPLVRTGLCFGLSVVYQIIQVFFKLGVFIGDQ